MARPPRPETRERIVAAASGAFRRHGYAATGVDAVMAEAGLTHGGFYAHFASKRDLLQAAVAYAPGNRLYQQVAHLHGEAFLAAAITRYLSRHHRDHPEEGCPIPTLGAELPRLEPELGACMGGPVQGLHRRLAEALPAPEETRAARAAAVLAVLVGGVLCARTLPDTSADAWLADCRRQARLIAGLAAEDT